MSTIVYCSFVSCTATIKRTGTENYCRLLIATMTICAWHCTVIPNIMSNGQRTRAGETKVQTEGNARLKKINNDPIGTLAITRRQQRVQDHPTFKIMADKKFPSLPKSFIQKQLDDGPKKMRRLRDATRRCASAVVNLHCMIASSPAPLRR